MFFLLQKIQMIPSFLECDAYVFTFSFAVRIYLILINLCRFRFIGIHACHVISGTELALVETNLLSLEDQIDYV